MAGAKITKVDDKKKKKFAIEIESSVYGRKRQVLYTKNEKELDEWISFLKKETIKRTMAITQSPDTKVVFLFLL